MALVDQILIKKCTYRENSQQATCANTITASIQQWVESLGYDAFYFGCGKRWGKDDVFYSNIISTYNKEWTDKHLKNKWYRYDPIVRCINEGQSNNEIVQYGTWQQAFDYALANPLGDTRDQRAHYRDKVHSLLKAVAQYAMHSGMYVAYGGKDHSMQVCFTSHIPDLSHCISKAQIQSIVATMPLIVLLMDQLDGCAYCSSLRVAMNEFNEGFVLTSSQKVVLNLFLENPAATTEDVAKSYGATSATINHHLGCIRRKLDKPHVSGHMLAQFAADNKLL